MTNISVDNTEKLERSLESANALLWVKHKEELLCLVSSTLELGYVVEK